MKSIYAEDVNFWKTGKSSPDRWMDLSKAQIKTLGGKVVAEGFGSDASGKAAFMLGFTMADDSFKVVWPVLPQRYTGGENAARVQAATMLYHYVKSTCLYALVVGARTAFFSHLMLPDGRVAAQVASEELSFMAPQLLLVSP